MTVGGQESYAVRVAVGDAYTVELRVDIPAGHEPPPDHIAATIADVTRALEVLLNGPGPGPSA